MANVLRGSSFVFTNNSGDDDIKLSAGIGETMQLENPSIINATIDVTDKQVLFSDVGTIAGDTGLTFDKTANTLVNNGLFRSTEYRAADPGKAGIQFNGDKMFLVSGNFLKKLGCGDTIPGVDANAVAVSIGGVVSVVQASTNGVSCLISGNSLVNNLMLRTDNALAHDLVIMRNSNGIIGSITCTGTTTAYNTTSSSVLKKNVMTCNEKLSKISQLRVCDYDWIDNDVPECGLIAEEAAVLFPDLVNLKTYEQEHKEDPTEREYSTIQYMRFVPLLIQCIKDLEARIIALETV